jgi:hypothetical protein
MSANSSAPHNLGPAFRLLLVLRGKDTEFGIVERRIQSCRIASAKGGEQQPGIAPLYPGPDAGCGDRADRWVSACRMPVDPDPAADPQWQLVQLNGTRVAVELDPAAVRDYAQSAAEAFGTGPDRPIIFNPALAKADVKKRIGRPGPLEAPQCPAS